MAIEHQDILPPNATPFERLFADVLDPLPVLGELYDGIRLSAPQRSPAPDFMPFLVWQYGLGELTPYLPNIYDLIDDGIQWQRVRGTPAAVRKGFGWLTYDCEVENHPTRRRLWNKADTHLDRVRDEDVPDLARLAGIGQLSMPERSIYWRGWHGYNVPAAETSYTRLSGSLLGDDSGVRIDGVAPKWSFGREHPIDHTCSEADLTAIDAWIPEVPEGDLWADADYLWAEADFQWDVPAATARRNAIALDIAGRSVWVRFADSGDATLGYRRAVALPVKAVGSGGDYTIGAQQWLREHESPTAVLVYAQTGFGDGAGSDVAAVSLVFDATPDGVPPGRLWLADGDLAGGTEIAAEAAAIEFGLTVRERILFLMRF